MAIKGQIAKEEITNKILETFNGSFKNDKEIRIPWVEGGERVQVKLTLVAAKDLIENADAPLIEPVAAVEETSIEISADEKANLARLLRSLGL